MIKVKEINEEIIAQDIQPKYKLYWICLLAYVAIPLVIIAVLFYNLEGKPECLTTNLLDTYSEILLRIYGIEAIIASGWWFTKRLISSKILLDNKHRLSVYERWASDLKKALKPNPNLNATITTPNGKTVNLGKAS